MAHKNYTADYVINILNRNPSIYVDPIRQIIKIVRGADTIGNRSWGKIDFLVHYCNYVVVKVDKIVKRPKRFTDKDELEQFKAQRYNMVADVKNKMKKIKIH